MSEPAETMSTEPVRRDLSATACVVGGGPAGTAAVLTLMQGGVDVVWCHDGPVRKQLPADGVDAVTRLPGTVVWDAAPGVVHYHRAEASGSGEPASYGTVRAPFLVLATGAVDRHLAFPGWDADTVHGAAQVLYRLRRGGAAPDAPIRLLGLGWHMQAVGEARGRLGVETGTLLGEGAFPPPVPTPGTGSLVTCFGLVPATELAALAGAVLDPLPAAGGWVPRRLAGLPVVEIAEEAIGGTPAGPRPKNVPPPRHPIHPSGSVLVPGAAGGTVQGREPVIALTA